MKFEKETIAGWGNYPMTECLVGKPRHISETMKLKNEPELIARGLGRSYADQAVNSSGVVVDFRNINRIISFDEKKGIVECEAGLSIADMISIFSPRGWFPLITPGTKYVTIGGAIANDVHGKAHHIDGSFIDSVISISILTGRGVVLTADRKNNADLFEATFGGLGLTGIILSAKLKLRKISTTYFSQKSIAARNLDEMLDFMEEADRNYNYSVAWVDPLARGDRLGRGVLTAGNEAGIDDLPGEMKKTPLNVRAPSSVLNVPVFMPDFTLNALSLRVLNRVIETVQKSPKTIVGYEKFFYPLDAVQNWNRGYGKRGFIQYQFVVPADDGKRRMAELIKMIADSGCNPFLNVLKKFGNRPGGLLAFPMEGFNFAVDFPMSRNLLKFTAKLDRAVLERGGRIYAGKDGVTDGDTFHEMYPSQVKKFLKIKKKYDPDNRFRSSISKRLKLDLESAQ